MATNNDVDDIGCVYFYKDTINTGKIKMCCIYEGVIKMYFSTLITFQFKVVKGGFERNFERLCVERTLFSRKDKCCIQINHAAKTVYYQYEDDFQQDFRSIPDFLQSCIDEQSKKRIIIKMGALYETVYKPFGVNRLVAELSGKLDYQVLKELY
jgi:ribosomal protein S17E